MHKNSRADEHCTVMTSSCFGVEAQTGVMLFRMVDDWKKVSVEFVQRKKNGMMALNDVSGGKDTCHAYLVTRSIPQMYGNVGTLNGRTGSETCPLCSKFVHWYKSACAHTIYEQTHITTDTMVVVMKMMKMMINC